MYSIPYSAYLKYVESNIYPICRLLVRFFKARLYFLVFN